MKTLVVSLLMVLAFVTGCQQQKPQPTEGQLKEQAFRNAAGSYLTAVIKTVTEQQKDPSSERLHKDLLRLKDEFAALPDARHNERCNSIHNGLRSDLGHLSSIEESMRVVESAERGKTSEELREGTMRQLGNIQSSAESARERLENIQ